MELFFGIGFIVLFLFFSCIIYMLQKHGDVGDLIDNIHFYMWFPLLNTLMLIIVLVGIAIIKIWELSKLNILWEKFRNIKLK